MISGLVSSFPCKVRYQDTNLRNCIKCTKISLSTPKCLQLEKKIRSKKFFYNYKHWNGVTGTTT